MASSINSPNAAARGHASGSGSGLTVRALDLASPKRRPISSDESWKTPLPKPAAPHTHIAPLAPLAPLAPPVEHTGGKQDLGLLGLLGLVGPADTSYWHSSSASLCGGSYQGSGESYQGSGGSQLYTGGVQAPGPVSTSWRRAMADLEA